MQILYTNFHKSPGIGGHSIYILSLINALAARHDLTVAVPASSGLYRRAHDIGNVHVAAQDYPNRPAELWRAARRLRALMIERDIQVVHVNGSADHRLVMLARMGLGSRKPAVVFTKHNDQRIRPLSAFVRAALGTDHVIAVCDFVRRRVDATPYRRIGVSTIPNGIDTTHYDRVRVVADTASNVQVQAYRQAWSADQAVVFGSQAGTDDYKGWMDLVHAVASLPQDVRARVRIALAGALPSDRQREEVQQARMADHVFFTGPLDDVRPFLAAIDVGFVLSWRVETISFACREMMSMGVPVMVSDHGGLPENITSGTDGWIVPRRDMGAIARCVQQIVATPQAVAQIGQAAQARARNMFGIERFVSATEAVYQKLVTDRR